MPGFDGLDVPNGNNSDSRAQPISRDSHEHLPSTLISSSFPITLKFIDVSYGVKIKDGSTKTSCVSRLLNTSAAPSDQTRSTATTRERKILHEITAMVSPGEILAVLGPSGSGKSTLLNAIAGRLHGPTLTGTILVNDKKSTKQTLKRTGFVPQDDVLYPHLTVRETLVFCSLLRLPNSLTTQQKTKIAESVITELGLDKCENTIIGNGFIRGVSGGERKRVSIAHEMLMNPSLLILDEPTSGMDSTVAHRLVQTLRTLAHGKGKTVVTSVHQPSSRVFQMFDSVLLLSEGRCLYFGKGRDAMAYFESVGFSPAFPVNPADFLLDLANGIRQLDGGSETEKSNTKQTLISSYNNTLGHRVKATCMDFAPQSPLSLKDTTTTSTRTASRFTIIDWFNQFTILLQRSLKERKHESFNALRVFQVIAASLLAGLMWWHSVSYDVQDRLGLIFFISIFWGVLPSFNAVFAFPQERAVFMKERASGMYTLSPYFMARVVGDLPMELILPFVFLAIAYWMTGLNADIISFILTLSVLLGYVLVSQGLGLFLGAAIMDAKKASTIVTVTMLAFVLTGGYYVHKIPACMGWMKYVSATFYCYRLLINVQYGQGEKISEIFNCMASDGSKIRDKASCRFIEEDIRGQISPATSTGVMILMFFGYRLLAYLALRRFKI